MGIDVKNAVFMIIEDAQRFGLSQLHQLRGRVGRGENKSYCILFCKDPSEKTRERLEIFCRTNDGFEIAREDLRLRGPGDFLGRRQHGLPVLKVADVFSDARTIYQTHEAAQTLLQEDPGLVNGENGHLKMKVAQIMEGNEKNIFN
ncbi:Transcription-repair-coupling factor [bioreactor metagenome]|uniref:Transcription-repair-coupling factor n=1 Tax=bioreactor metagenome TaxID=1076179 RepID=A0A645C3A2_9ZZZZ